MKTVENILEIISPFEKKSYYLGNEWNAVKKNWEEINLKIALCFPENYNIGMSHLGLQILYGIINNLNYALAERVFLPQKDLLQYLEENNIPLFSLESKAFLTEFHLIGFSLMYELTYTNFLKMLSLAEIPLLAVDRKNIFPLICAGGGCMFNAEPVADFLDFAVIGEGEEIITEITEVLNHSIIKNFSKENILQQLAKIEGVYVPKFYKVKYFTNSSIAEILPVVNFVPKVIKKRYIKDLNKVFYPTKFIVPYGELVQERIALEIFRGCTQGCRYCQAGMIYRPLRERNVNCLVKIAKQSYENTGLEEISILSLSTSDYSQLNELITQLNTYFADLGVVVSLPSLRPKTFAENISALKNLKKGNLTLVAEAASERLRKVINKNLTTEDIYKAIEIASKYYFKTLKIYFMIGLPTETMEDIKEIVTMLNFILSLTKKTPIKQITVSLSTFVPKPHTPFQWEKQDSLENIYKKQNYLMQKLTHPKLKLNWVQPEKSLLEGIFSRGNRLLGKVLLRAFNKKLFFTATDEVNFKEWEKCFKEENIDYFNFVYLEKEKSFVFPWEHINCGVNKNFLWLEKQKSLKGELTLNCKIKCIYCDPKKEILQCVV